MEGGDIVCFVLGGWMGGLGFLCVWVGGWFDIDEDGWNGRGKGKAIAWDTYPFSSCWGAAGRTAPLHCECCAMYNLLWANANDYFEAGSCSRLQQQLLMAGLCGFRPNSVALHIRYNIEIHVTAETKLNRPNAKR
jgi:hypothetical protein